MKYIELHIILKHFIVCSLLYRKLYINKYIYIYLYYTYYKYTKYNNYYIL